MNAGVFETSVDPRLRVDALAAELRAAADALRRVPLSAILDLLDAYSQALAREATASVEGVAFLSLWMRRGHLEDLVDRSLHGGSPSLDRFVTHGEGLIKAQPKGLVCHWVAGNVPTLPVFSWVIGLLCKNVSLVRVSRPSIAPTQALLATLERTASAGKFTATRALECVRFLHFDSEDQARHASMSLAADAKLVWGGGRSVEAVTRLPRQPHCNEVVFGPKYSVGVICRQTQENPAILERTLDAFVRDVMAFDQSACSSPQTIFVERSARGSEAIRDRLAERLARATRAARIEVDSYTTTRIYQTRAAWGLASARTFRAPIGAQWSVCLDRSVELKQAIQARTVFLVEVEDLAQVPACMTPRVQTLGLAVCNPDRALELADQCTARGVARCVRPGLMNVYDLPWDGRMTLSELVNWVSVKR